MKRNLIKSSPETFMNFMPFMVNSPVRETEDSDHEDLKAMKGSLKDILFLNLHELQALHGEFSGPVLIPAPG
jgi:hypothetical protein